MHKLLRIIIFHVYDLKTLTAISVFDLAGTDRVSTSSHYHFARAKLLSIEIHAYRDMLLSYASSLKEYMLTMHVLKSASMKKSKDLNR